MEEINTQIPHRINHNSDFDFVIILKDANGNDLGFPEFDFRGIVYVGEPCKYSIRKFVFSRKDDDIANCFNDNGNIHVVCDNHGLPKGKLCIDFRAEIPNDIYPDKRKLVVVPQSLGIELVCEKSDVVDKIEVEIEIPYVIKPTGDDNQGEGDDSGDSDVDNSEESESEEQKEESDTGDNENEKDIGNVEE